MRASLAGPSHPSSESAALADSALCVQVPAGGGRPGSPPEPPIKPHSQRSDSGSEANGSFQATYWCEDLCEHVVGEM